MEPEKAMSHLNLERGFRRIMTIVSLAILIPGVLYAMTWWLGEKRAWTDALKQPDAESQIVWIITAEVHGKAGSDPPVFWVPGAYIAFEKQKTETEIVTTIEDILVAESTGRRAGFALEEILGRPAAETLPVSFVYRPAAPARPGHLYSVKELLEGHHAGTLPEDVKETIDKLSAEKPSRLPWKSWTTKPVVFGVPGLAGALGLATGMAAVPWVVFFLLRWIVNGFRKEPEGK